MKNIKENSGKNIKNVADGVLGLGVIIAVIMGLSLLVVVSNLVNAVVGIIVFIVEAVIIIAIAWVISVFSAGSASWLRMSPRVLLLLMR
ncbi:MAG: hypothetical protein LUH18_04580 [Oscillospiraceae bacterium]|nr:hypothetical protein [Oscillospiraceae bacterium]